jgi:hypothetical protein
VDAGAAADDLLEFRHRADFAVEDDEPARLGIDARREEARRGDDDGIRGFGVDEAADLGPAFVIVALGQGSGYDRPRTTLYDVEHNDVPRVKERRPKNASGSFVEQKRQIQISVSEIGDTCTSLW